MKICLNSICLNSICFYFFIVLFSDCGGDINVTSPTNLLSPGYPGDYGSNLNCGWRISVPEGKRVSITINSLAVTRRFNLCIDYLLIYDRSQPDNQYRRTR